MHFYNDNWIRIATTPGTSRLSVLEYWVNVVLSLRAYLPLYLPRLLHHNFRKTNFWALPFIIIPAFLVPVGVTQTHSVAALQPWPASNKRSNETWGGLLLAFRKYEKQLDEDENVTGGLLYRIRTAINNEANTPRDEAFKEALPNYLVTQARRLQIKNAKQNKRTERVDIWLENYSKANRFTQVAESKTNDVCTPVCVEKMVWCLAELAVTTHPTPRIQTHIRSQTPRSCQGPRYILLMTSGG